MTNTAHLRTIALLVSVVAVLVALLQPTASATTEQDDVPPSPAMAALSKVQELLAGGPGQAHRAPHGNGRADHSHGESLTMALRDLALVKDNLRGRDRRTAERILARPADGDGPAFEPTYRDGCGGLLEPRCPDVERTCNSRVCVHYVTEGPHAAAPSFAGEVRSAATRSLRRFDDWGWRAPLRDAGRGGDDRPDIYLVDLPRQIFGYAAAEGYWIQGGPHAYFGYAVVDRNFADQCALSGGPCTSTQKGSLMRATVAHELFHLTQFGYDATADAWLMEGTAVWVEDQVFPTIKDNVNYLWAEPNKLRNPEWPLDHPHANWYGNWIFFRYLSERFGRIVVRRIWNQVDAWRGYNGSRTPPDRHSIEAVRAVVRQVSDAWNREFARFHAHNRFPHRLYSEARTQKYPASPLHGNFELNRSTLRRTRSVTLDHLSGVTYRIRPSDLRSGWRLRVRLEGNSNNRSFGMATIKRRDGRLQRARLSTGANGIAVRDLPFGSADVRWVEITIVNASTRYSCWRGDRFDGTDHRTCKGTPLDDGANHRLVARAIRN
jgi:hypothetical protein